MRPQGRLFEIIQILRAASAPVTAEALAARLEVSVRTVYRDVAALQAMGTPVDGEAGVGYLLRRGYDLPPLNFETEEIEALHVGLSMLARTGDSALQRAALRVRDKIDALHPGADWICVSPWGAPVDNPDCGCVSVATLREAVREARKLRIIYRDGTGSETVRTIRPLVLVYHIESTLLAAWCELRGDFRHFRTDRLYGCEVLDECFAEHKSALRSLWQEQHEWAPGR